MITVTVEGDAAKPLWQHRTLETPPTLHDMALPHISQEMGSSKSPFLHLSHPPTNHNSYLQLPKASLY